MCLEIAGSVISNGSASSLTVAAPSARRARIARRVELASAAKVSLSRSSSTIVAIVTPQSVRLYLTNTESTEDPVSSTPAIGGLTRGLVISVFSQLRNH